jgi:EAL domain-containing protein (putative c-di-GMP-specific phosphodiesterase class I)
VFLAVREIARGFGMHLVAEGVETADEAAQLVALGVDFVQGYLYGRPAPAHVATALVDAALDSAVAADGPVTHWSAPAPATSPVS